MSASAADRPADVEARRTDVEVVHAPQVLLGERLVRDAWVAHRGGRVLGAGQGTPPSPITTHLPEGVLAPGLVDAQVNGAFGVDLVAADEAGWDRVQAGLLATGVTAFVPTFITAPLPELQTALGLAAQRLRTTATAPTTTPATTPATAPATTPRARVLGIHVEGPFLAPTRRGAHDAAWLRHPTDEAVDGLLAAGAGALRYVTLAPELPGALDAVQRFVAAGVEVAIGHTDAQADQARAAVDAGARLVTHLFNAQRPFTHRDPGVVGVALTDPRLTLGLIVDGIHVAPTAVALAFAAASGRIMLVTDAVAALGLPTGRSVLGGAPVIVHADGTVRRADGVLAGSTLRLDVAVATAVAAGVDRAVALTAATRVPADALGRPDLGRIAPGLAADLVWLGGDGRTRATWVSGRRADPPEAP